MRDEGYQMNLYCDTPGCPTPTVVLHTHSKGMTYKEAKRMGWKLAVRIDGSRDLCPACVRMSKASLTYWKACGGLSQSQVPILYQMREAANQVTIGTFRNRIGSVEISEWAQAVGYAKNRGHGPVLDDDPLVKFYFSYWGSEPCAYLTWSGQEHIWRIRE